MSEIQVLPLPRVHPIWDPKHPSKYPPMIRVSMSDGNVVNYLIEIQQPTPILKNALEHFDMVVGYEKPADVAAPNRPRGKIFHEDSITKGEKRK